MAAKLTKNDWCKILLRTDITRKMGLTIFRKLYGFEGHQASAKQVGLLMGYGGKSPHAPLNLEIGRYAKRIAEHFDITFSKRSHAGKVRYWDVFFDGWYDDDVFIWKLKVEICEALVEVGMATEELFPEELGSNGGRLMEGAKLAVVVNRYERNSEARNRCIAWFGCACSVCGVNFEERYGELGKGFIHVHHLIPISEIGESYQIDPVKDLRPVCPNCHAMLHRGDPNLLTIEELQKRMK